MGTGDPEGMRDLEGRVAIITGAGRGIGRAHALLFGSLGAHVVVNDVGSARDGSGGDGTPGEAVAAEIVAAGGTAIANTESITDWQAAKRLVEMAIETFGDLHVLVNNAGIVRDRTIANMSEEDFDTVVAVHLKGSFTATRWAAEYWRDEAKAGRLRDRAIVNTSSGSGLHGNRGQINYGAAKAGIAAMTLVEQIELAAYGVRANCIAPFARTRMLAETPGITPETVADANGGFDPLDAANISPLVAYLAASDCDFRGQVFSVFGGSVGIYQGWSVAHEITSVEGWTFAELCAAMDEMPRSVPANTQLDMLASRVAP